MSAGSDNQIAIDLKLQLDSLGADAAKAGKIISKELGSATKSDCPNRPEGSSYQKSANTAKQPPLKRIATDSDRANKSATAYLASSVRGLGETTYEREDRQAEEKKQREKQREKRERAARNRKLDEADAAKDAKEAAKKATIASAAQAKQAQASKVGRGQIIRAGVAGLAGVGLGVPGLGSIAALAQISPVAAAVTASLKVLGAAIQMTARSAEEAKRYYSKTLQSGFGTQLTIKRSLLANAIGVGENEVWQYGAAVSALNEKFSHATKVLSEANPVLTQLSWDTSVLSADFQALKAKIAVEMAPAVQGFIGALDELLKWLTEHGHDLAGKWLGPGFVTDTSAERKSQIDNDFTNKNYYKYKGNDGYGSGVGPLKALMEDTGGNYGEKFRKKFEKWSLKNFEEMAGGLGVSKMKSSEIFSWMHEGMPAAGGAKGAPSPVAYMKQLPASQWEHMGLIVGGSGTNYARDTAKNTAKAADFLSKLPKEIADALSKFQNKNPNQVSIPSMP